MKLVTEYYVPTWKKVLDFSGRASRNEFWTCVTENFWIAIILAVIGGITGFGGFFLFFIPFAAVYVRRFHDVGLSAWWAFGPFILSLACALIAVVFIMLELYGVGGRAVTFIGDIVWVVQGVALLAAYAAMVVVLAWKGQKKPNRYGPVPVKPGEEKIGLEIVVKAVVKAAKKKSAKRK